MNKKYNTLKIGVVLVLAALLNFTGESIAQNNPLPSLYSISPETVERGNQGITISLFGDNFVSTASVSWDGTTLAVNFVSASELEANVPAELLTRIDTVVVYVINPGPGGGSSENKNFIITGVEQIVNSLAPVTIRQDAENLSLVVYGSNFTENSVVRIDGNERSTMFLSSTEIHTSLLRSDIENVGSCEITVYNFGSGGVSNAVNFEVIYGSPTIISMTPDLRKVRDAGFVITINGSLFAPACVVYFDDVLLTTTFVSASQVKATIPDELVNEPKTYSVTVKNPLPGGGSSNIVSFVVVDPVPVINKIDPRRQKPGSPGFMMKLEGSGFTFLTKGLVNGSERITTFVNENLIYLSIGSADLQIVGSYPITVKDLSLSKNESKPLYLVVSDNKRKVDPPIGNVTNGFGDFDGVVSQNYPNPFNPLTEIRFALSSDAVVSLDVYNSVGQKISTLIDKIEMSAGEHAVSFDGADLSSGQYFYNITSVDLDGKISHSMNKMILIK
ncbi:MAG: hypothetical protein HY964_02600 [Ignavibacteriales bacterium]|nr:hypothetical protein [Ignavibacteriales bacterium]